MKRSGIKRDTIRLTLIQLFLECGGMVLNVWLTEEAGAASVGMVALIGAFYQFASTVTGGSGYLCASRFVAEELGKPDGNPQQMLYRALCFGGMLGIPGSIGILLAAQPIAAHVLHDAAMQPVVQVLALLLPFGGWAACFKGWCNAVGRAWAGAICEAVEFVVRTAVLMGLLMQSAQLTSLSVCRALTRSMAAGTFTSLALLLWVYCRHHRAVRTVAGAGCHSSRRIRLSHYLRYAVPVMFGSCLTSALSMANDALIPVTLRQSGSSAERALAQFGIFEGIVLPVLFFPSMLLCVLSGLLIPEAARAGAAGNRRRLQYITQRTLRLTILYSIGIAVVLLCYGTQIGACMQAEPLAGKMIQLLAPVVPFIYLEIILEAILKGMGAQRFSSWNYFGEYGIRISVVLICIPLWGFYGILVSYYLSNLIGNCLRLRKTVQLTGIRLSAKELIGKPLFAAAAAFIPIRVLLRLLHPDPQTLPWGIAGAAAGLLAYVGICRLLRNNSKSDNHIGKRKRHDLFQSVQ